MQLATSQGMDRVRFPVGSMEGEAKERKAELETGALRKKLVNLALDWELAALTLDGQGYKPETCSDGESLRASAVVYRKCIAELTEALSGASVWKKKQAA